MKNPKFDRFKVNPKLYEYAIGEMPYELTPLEEARHIYKRLCKKLSYSLDYFIEEMTNGSPFTPIKRKMSKLDYVETVDGEKNNEVVCFVFSAIFSYILYDRGLISEEDFHENLHIRCDDFWTDHTELTCKIDGVNLRIDGSIGLDMDLSKAKYGYNELRGWKEGFIGNNPEARVRLEELFAKERSQLQLKKVRCDLYKTLKKNQDDYKRLSFDEKVSLFLDSVQDTPAYSFESLSYIHEVYRKVFTYEDVSAIPKRIDSSFIYLGGELKEFLFINKNGYEDFEGKENFDSLEIYEISLKDKSIEKLDRNQLLKKAITPDFKVFSNGNSKNLGSEMMNHGRNSIPSKCEGKDGK